MTATVDRTGALNLRRLFVLRAVAVGGEVVALTLVTVVLDIALPVLPLLVVIALHAGAVLLLWRRLSNPAPVTALEFFMQLVLDVLALMALLYFTGGSTNPFVSFFLLPLIITAAVLSPAYTWAMAALTISCYTLLIYFYVALPHLHAGGSDRFDLHVIGMWFGFLLGAALIVLVVVRMARTLRESAQELAKTREQMLRDEHMIAIGTLATGAAHELGTPLATMAVLAGELQRDHADDPDIADKARMLRAQLERCKGILSDISASVGRARPVDGRSYALDEYLEAVVTEWRAARPAVCVIGAFDGTRPAPRVVIDKTLTQALTNILNNAADASVDSVEVSGVWDFAHLTLTVSDRGAGLSSDAHAVAGTPWFTTKPEGQGLGLFLARSVIERYGGSLQLGDRAGGGTCATIDLPLSRLVVKR